ncbi:MAG TPA: FkbM family methyltransferase [Methylococcaceae bacterium]|nr:FkbM family methyltransferase [Methylococcaceae bacterium]
MKETQQTDLKAQNKPWGCYAPTAATRVLRLIAALGISRGQLRKWVARQWKKSGWHFVDYEKQGIRYRLDILNNTTDEKILTSSKTYDREEIEFLALRVLDANSCFVDVGANTGYYSLSLAQKGFKKILAIEPNPPTLSLLKNNVELNDLESVIEVMPVCVGEEGDVPFYSTGVLGGASRLAPSALTREITLPSLPLEKILLMQGIDKISSLKIDIEGYEDRALVPFFLHAPEPLWPIRIVIEDCHKDKWETDVVELMLEKGYRLVKQTRGNAFLEKDE